MSSTIDKLKDKLHLRRKSQDIGDAGASHGHVSEGMFSALQFLLHFDVAWSLV